jgi:hypothetical protein
LIVTYCFERSQVQTVAEDLPRPQDSSTFTSGASSARLTAAVAAYLAFETFGLPTLAMFAALAGLATESGRLAFQSLMQTNAPGGAQGRVFVRYEVVFQLAWVAGALIPSMFPLPFRGGILAMAVYYAVLAALYLIRVRRLARRGDAGAGPTT